MMVSYGKSTVIFCKHHIITCVLSTSIGFVHLTTGITLLEQFISQSRIFQSMYEIDQKTISVGIIPGPSEPHSTVNSYLAPLQQELIKGWNEGFVMEIPDRGGGVREVPVRLALTCVACDIPAARKVCGFFGP